MAGFDYGRMQATATRLLTRFNQGVVTLTRLTQIPPEHEWEPPIEASAEYTLQATVASITVDQASAKYIDGTLIVATDLVVTCAAPLRLAQMPDTEPMMTDIVSIDGRARTLKKIVQVPAAGVVVAFKVFVSG